MTNTKPAGELELAQPQTRAIARPADPAPAALAKHSSPRGLGRQRYEPRTFAELNEIATVIARSSLLPSGANSAADCAMLLLHGAELGLTVAQSLASLYVVEGRPGLSARAMHGLILRSGLAKYFRVIETSAERAVWETLRAGETKPAIAEFTKAEAERAGLWTKPNWRNYPAEMLSARASSRLARRVYPDVILGFEVPGEIDPSPAPDAEAFGERPAGPLGAAAVDDEAPASSSGAVIDATTGEVLEAPADQDELRELGNRLVDRLGRIIAEQVWREEIGSPRGRDPAQHLEVARTVVAKWTRDAPAAARNAG